MRNALSVKRLLLLFLLFALSLAPGRPLCADWRGQPMADPQAAATPLLPFLDYYLDETYTMDVEEAAAPGLASAFKPLVPENLPRAEGVMWLRFTLAPLAPDARPRAFLLDMGQSVPGRPLLYDPERNELSGALEWRENAPAQRDILLLPEAGPEPIVCYIRLEGLPGPWFAPMIRSPQNAASNMGGMARSGAILALGVVMLLCILRGLSENGQWRIWTGLFVAVALAQALYGMPAATGRFSLTNLGAILAPGIALMLLPHVGRHLMRAPQISRSIDIQLLLLSLPGAALALAPLAPGFIWIERWLDLWPGATIIFLPTALGAWMMGMPGSRRFLLGCLVPPILVAISWFGLDFGLPPNLLASGPLWGVAICSLLIAATAAPKALEAGAVSNVAEDAGEITDLGRPFDDPNLRLVRPADPARVEEAQERMEFREPEQSVAARKEEAMLEPLEEIERQAAALGQCALPPIARESAEKMLAAVRKLEGIASGAEMPQPVHPAKRHCEIFNLQRILRNAHDSIASSAEYGGSALSWCMPPYLGLLYRGDAEGLEEVLKLLAESAARACEQGSIRISARRVPNSADPGNIIFTVFDTGSGYPPRDRSSLAIARAWEYAGRHDGYLGVETGPEGASVSFSARFEPCDEAAEAAPDFRPHVILACEDSARRHELAKIIEGLPARVSEAASAHEAIGEQKRDPAGLLVTCGDLARPAAADMAFQFENLARAAGFTEPHALAITRDDSQWALLKPSGFTHAMLEPFETEALLDTVRELLPERIGGVALSKKDDAPLADNPEKAGKPEPAAEKPDESPARRDSGKMAGVPLQAQEAVPAPKRESQPGKEDVLTDPGNNEAESGWMEKGFEEWVGEPMPVGAPPAPPAKAAPEAPKKVEKAPEKERPAPSYISPSIGISEEWVGEPMPVGGGQIQKKREAEAAQNTAQVPEAPADGSGSLTDFIVEIGEPEPAGKEPVQAEPQDGAPAIGEKDAKDGDPIISTLLKALDEDMAAALAAFDRHDCVAVAGATERIAAQAENFGLRHLSRMARCVERAAQADDLASLRDLLPELSFAVERNRITLS